MAKDTSALLGRKLDPQIDKRSSSRSKLGNKSTDKINKGSTIVKSNNLKELKEEGLEA